MRRVKVRGISRGRMHSFPWHEQTERLSLDLDHQLVRAGSACVHACMWGLIGEPLAWHLKYNMYISSALWDRAP